MARLVWPASSCTSCRLPPTWETLRAARVMKVRRPECDEQPSIFSEVYSRWNHKRTVAGDNPPPRSEKMMGRSGPTPSHRHVWSVTSAVYTSGCMGQWCKGGAILCTIGLLQFCHQGGRYAR